MATPLHADTPWWSNLVGVLVTFVVTLLGTLYLMGRGTQLPSSTGSFGVSTFFVDTLTYIPHILLLFGVLADMLTYQGVYSIPSLIGVISVLANFGMKFFWAGVGDMFVTISRVISTRTADIPVNPRADVPGRTILSGGAGGDFFKQYDGCSIQGLDFLRNPYAPQTLVFTATVFSYYIFDLLHNRGVGNATATIVLACVLFAAQAAVIGSCAQSDDEPSRVLQIIASLSEGLLFGGVGYSVVQAYYPGRLPSTAISPFPKKTADQLSPGPNGTFKDESGNPYVCLPSGQCYPDLSSTESRTAFASIAAANLGTGAPAVPENCSATPSEPSE